MRIGFVNYSVPNCGVHQYASNLFQILRQSRAFEFSYFPISSQEELDQVAQKRGCGLMMINYHPQTMPFLSIGAGRRYDVPCMALMHEMTQEEADSMPAAFFQYYVMGDPTLVERNPRVFRTGRLIPQFDNRKPVPAIPTIGSFGFSVGSKGFRRMVDVVQEEFDEAVIRVNIPPNGIIDPQGQEARRIAESCKARIWKPHIQFVATHDFLSQEQLLDFLAANTVNALLYDYVPQAGISSAADQALTVRRPVAITRSVMFRHLIGLQPPISIEDTSLRQIIKNGIAPYAHLLVEWSPERLLARYEEIVAFALSNRDTASGFSAAAAGGPRPRNKETCMPSLATRITHGIGRRAKRYVVNPTRQFAKELQVRIPIGLGMTTARSRFNRILDDAARIEYREVISRLHALAPDVLAKKIPRANIQQAFVFDTVERFARQRTNPRILCVGSFEDSAAVSLKRAGYSIEEIDPAVNGLDLNSFMKLPTTRPGSYDIVFSTSVLEHVRDDENFVVHMAELLAPGGVGILTCDFKEGYRVGDPVIDGDFRFYTKRDLAERLAGCLRDCQFVDVPAWDSSNPDFELGGFRYTFATFTFRKRDQPDVTADWSGMSPPEQARFYCENGFLVVPAALSADEVRQALAEIRTCGLKGTTEEVWDAPFARRLVTNARILAALRSIFGEHIKFFKAAYVETLPSSTGQPATQRKALHVDYGIGEPEGDFRNSAASWVNVGIYLTDLTAEHSPLWVCAGSNRDYSVAPASDLERFAGSAKMVFAKAGDAVLFHANTVHAASHNYSAEPRHALFYSYRPAWAKPIGPVREWPEQFIDSFPIEHRAMLRDMNRGL